MCKDRLFGLLGLMCSFATGCFSHAPYGHPNAYAPPHTAMVSPPYGTVPSAPGTVWVPASPAGSSTLSAPEPVRRAAPTSFGEEGDLDADKPVPTPTEFKKAPLPEVEASGFDDDASLERPGVRTGRIARPQPLNEELEFATESRRLNPELDFAEDSASSTSKVRSATFQTDVRSNAVVPASAVSDKYGYDAEGYSWLKGVIEFDPKLQIWHLTYSQNPDDDDQFGGEVTLMNAADFRYFRSGEAVRVEGQFDSQKVDRLGKPLYDVVRVIRDAKR